MDYFLVFIRSVWIDFCTAVKINKTSTNFFKSTNLFVTKLCNFLYSRKISIKFSESKESFWILKVSRGEFLNHKPFRWRWSLLSYANFRAPAVWKVKISLSVTFFINVLGSIILDKWYIIENAIKNNSQKIYIMFILREYFRTKQQHENPNK